MQGLVNSLDENTRVRRPVPLKVSDKSELCDVWRVIRQLARSCSTNGDIRTAHSGDNVTTHSATRRRTSSR
jgi:hypothetical protein